MYHSTTRGLVCVSKDGNRWHGWKGRQAYRYVYGGPRKRG